MFGKLKLRPFFIVAPLVLVLGGAWMDLSPATQSVLGFESAADWTNANTTSPVHVQGERSLVVPVNGWTEVQSVLLSSIGAVDDTASISVELPSAVSWGEVRLIVKIPSQNEWYRDLGSQPLAGLPAGTFHDLEFPIPGDLATTFQAAYNDLTFTAVINAPPGDYLLDGLSLWDEGTTEPDAGAGGTGGSGGIPPSTFCECVDIDCSKCSVAFGMAVPDGVSPARVAIGVTEELAVNDRASVVANGTTAAIVNVGRGTTNLGADTWVSEVHSTAPVTLRSRAVVDGDVAIGWLPFTTQDGVEVHGQVRATASTSSSVRWKVVFPTGGIEDVIIEPDLVREKNPGDYGAVAVKSRAQLGLTAGTYTFRSLQLEPDSTLLLDTTRGSIEVWILDAFTYRGQLVHVGGDGSRVLFGVAGDSTVVLDAPWSGATLVAPNAKVELKSHSPTLYVGSFWARMVELFEGATVELEPLVGFSTSDVDGQSADTDGMDGPRHRNSGLPGATPRFGVCGAP